MKVFQVSDADWVAAETAAEASAFYKQETGLDASELDMLPTELTEQQLEEFMHTGDDGCEEGYPITFKQELEKNISDGVEFPCIFATTEI